MLPTGAVSPSGNQKRETEPRAGAYSARYRVGGLWTELTEYNKPETVAQVDRLALDVSQRSGGQFRLDVEHYISGSGMDSHFYWFSRQRGLGIPAESTQHLDMVQSLKKYETDLPEGVVLFRTSGLHRGDLDEYSRDTSYRNGTVGFHAGTSTSFDGAPSWLGGNDVLYVIEGVRRGVPVGSVAFEGEGPRPDEREIIILDPFTAIVNHYDEEAFVNIRNTSGVVRKHIFRAIAYVSVQM